MPGPERQYFNINSNICTNLQTLVQADSFQNVTLSIVTAILFRKEVHVRSIPDPPSHFQKML